jgi:hypothetical protein
MNCSLTSALFGLLVAFTRISPVVGGGETGASKGTTKLDTPAESIVASRFTVQGPRRHSVAVELDIESLSGENMAQSFILILSL